MKTIAFFDIKDYEKKFFTKHLSKYYKLSFNENSLNDNLELSDEELNCEIISVFTSSTLIGRVLEKFKNLELISTRSVGFNHIDQKYCLDRNIQVTNTPHYGDYTVAEFSFALLLNLLRNICRSEQNLSEGEFYPDNFGTELFSKTIGIVATGGIGAKSVKIAKGFSMKVLAYDLFPNNEIIKEYDVKYTDLDELCAQSDIIMLHAPLNSESYHLINKSRIEKMKSNAVIINTARGELIDTEALFEALSDNKIRGAALDVFENEDILSNKRPGANINFKNLRVSLINTKLLNLKNVLATPHMAYDTKEAVGRIVDITTKNLISYANGDGLVDSVCC